MGNPPTVEDDKDHQGIDFEAILRNPQWTNLLSKLGPAGSAQSGLPMAPGSTLGAPMTPGGGGGISDMIQKIGGNANSIANYIKTPGAANLREANVLQGQRGISAGENIWVPNATADVMGMAPAGGADMSIAASSVPAGTQAELGGAMGMGGGMAGGAMAGAGAGLMQAGAEWTKKDKERVKNDPAKPPVVAFSQPHQKAPMQMPAPMNLMDLYRHGRR